MYNCLTFSLWEMKEKLQTFTIKYSNDTSKSCTDTNLRWYMLICIIVGIILLIVGLVILAIVVCIVSLCAWTLMHWSSLTTWSEIWRKQFTSLITCTCLNIVIYCKTITLNGTLIFVNFVDEPLQKLCQLKKNKFTLHPKTFWNP